MLTTKGLEEHAYLRLNETARQVGMPLVGHAPYRVGLDGLLRAGQSLAHMNELANIYFLPPLSLRGEGSMKVAKWSLLVLLVLALVGNAARLAVLASVSLLLWILVLPPERLFGRAWLLVLLSALSILFLLEVVRSIPALLRAVAGRPAHPLAISLHVIALVAALGFAAALIRWVPFAWRGSDWGINRVAGNLREVGVWMQSTLVLYETGMGTRDGFRYEQRIADPAFRSLPTALQEQWKGIRQMVPPWMVKVWGRPSSSQEFPSTRNSGFWRKAGSRPMKPSGPRPSCPRNLCGREPNSAPSLPESGRTSSWSKGIRSRIWAP